MFQKSPTLSVCIQLAETPIFDAPPLAYSIRPIGFCSGESVPAMRIIREGMIEGLKVVGDRYEAHELFLAEIFMSARAVKEGLEVAIEALKNGEYEPKATIVIGSVKGDLVQFYKQRSVR